MRIRIAENEETDEVLDFYWDLIDKIKDQNNTVGWKKDYIQQKNLLRKAFLIKSFI